jgi:hypothetical protein
MRLRQPRALSALIFVALIANPFAASAQERIDHPAAGISLQRPAGWHDATLAQIQANRERVRLSDPELQKALETRSAMPVFAFAKYAEPYSGLNPSVQVMLRPRLSGTPTHLLSTAIEQMRRAFPDFRPIVPVQAAKVGAWPGAHVMGTYTLKSEAGERFRVLTRLWLVPRDKMMFLIGMSGTEAGADVCDEEFASVLASITIEK